MTVDDVVEYLRVHGLSRATAAEPMSRHTSWRIGGPADYLCVAEDLDQLLAAVRTAVRFEIPWLVLGGGNNVLVSDRGIEGLVILNRLRGIAIEESSDEGDGRHQLACGAGVFFAKAAQYTAKRGFTGMEWGIAIPGTVGGGVVNNAGAHSSDVAAALVDADVLDAAGESRRVSPADLQYHYRRSLLKTPHALQSRLVVTSCRFRIYPGDAAEALNKVEELRQHRRRTQPVKEASAGSTFTNPPGDFAGRLVEATGLKGHRIGGAQISPLHANFILNSGGAVAADVLALIRLARDTVFRQYGMDLQPEVQFVGRWRPEELEPVFGDAA
jgi:UDP-N-acetylmuramate dehydrogenase